MAQLSPFSTLDREGAEEGPPAESVSPVTDSAECIGVYTCGGCHICALTVLRS